MNIKMEKKIEEGSFSVLDKEKKAQILKDLHEEIERQKVKYFLDGSRGKESNEKKREELKLSYNPQKQFDQNSFDNHIDMLESAKDNLKKIQSDIQNMSNSNYAYNNNNNSNRNDNKDAIDNIGPSYDYEVDGEEHLNTNNERNYQLEDEGEEYNQDKEEQGEGDDNQNQHNDQQKPLDHYFPINKIDYNQQNQNDNDRYVYPEMINFNTKKPNAEEENLAEEEPKNLEHEMSISNHNYTSCNNNDINDGNQYVHINTNQSNNSNPNIKLSSERNNNRSVGGYNFFNPIDYNPNQHKGITTYNSDEILKKNSDKDKSKSREKDPFDLREKSFDYASNINNKIKQTQQIGERQSRSPYFTRMAKQYTPKYKSKEKYEIMKKEIESKFTKDHPFRPEINSTVQPKLNNESNQQRYERLSQPKTIEIEQRMKKKEQITQEQINSNLNYRPLTNPQSSSGRNVNPQSVANKLYKLHDQLKEKKEKMKRDYEDNKIKEYSFAPEINKESKLMMQKCDKRPIYERNDDFERLKNENLLKMRQEIEREQLSYYKPIINEKSKELANKKTSQSINDEGDIHEKLYRENIRNEKHKHSNPQLDECTFTPKLYYESYDDNDGGNIDDFLERQKVYEQLKKERLEKKIVKSNQKNDYTFTPKINLTSDILMKTNSLRANEGIEDKIDRLYKQDFEEIQKRKEQLQSFYNAQYDFKPKINELSRFIGRDMTTNELYQKPIPHQDKMNKTQSVVNDTECTFKPSINKEKYNHIQSNYKADEDIFNRINDEMSNKKQKITGLQSVIEKKKVEECKFKPEINREIPNFEAKEPMLMKGMAKHLGQMEKARKAKREKEEREKEVFITGDNWSRDNLITVPKPFKLSYQYQQKKVDTSTKKAKDNEMKECTFKPLTNETKNREIIRQLLKD